ncbi:MAG: transketolase C-terminal domain-containing protein [Thermodesulfobacteriota bacterium]|nr:transketolase C-terminal domain-containing protein [Thermodesulfobacteriota bacterium]
MNSTRTYAQSIKGALWDVLERDESVYILGEDICDPYGGAFKITKGLSSKWPGRVINTPISEAGIVGLSTGLAMRGLRPVVEIMFGDFMSLAYDQILSNLAKISWMYNGKVKTPVVIRTPMGGRRGYGPTHSQSIEKLFFGIPGIAVVAPSLFHDPGELLKKSIYHDAPILFIEYKLDYPKRLVRAADGMADFWRVRVSNHHFPLVRLSATDFEDDQVVILTYGGMVTPVLRACETLILEEEITLEVIIPSLVKPFELNKEIISSMEKAGKVIIIEEGTVSNGWGSELAACIGERIFSSLKKPVKRLGALNAPIGASSALEDAILPGQNNIIQEIKSLL